MLNQKTFKCPFDVLLQSVEEYTQLCIPNSQVMYSIKDLSKLFGKSKYIVRTILSDSDIPVYGNVKKFVFLSDLLNRSNCIKIAKEEGNGGNSDDKIKKRERKG